MNYNAAVDRIQDSEYPMLGDTTYLDHGGTTIYAKSLIENVAADLISNLYGNPHSASDPAHLSGSLVDETRERTLKFFGADPEHFDLVFVQNATAAMKLVMESFKDLGNASRTPDGKEGGFRYFYHVDCHNSVVGIREAADENYHCFRTDAEVDGWLSGSEKLGSSNKLGLFGYPGQSNMNGRRLPLNWTGRLRESTFPTHRDVYSLLDAAALATSKPLNLIFQDPDTAPDFTALSFYKIFGYPDLGALIVRKASGDILRWGRNYFGGGTVNAVTVLGNKPWYESKSVLHESLEDGTLPFHSIIALRTAIDTHIRLYGSDPMRTISEHTNFLGKCLFDSMTALVHPNGVPVCQIYQGENSTYGNSSTQAATVAFNVVQANGKYVPYTSVVETLANERKIFVRAGQLCNPGGIATHLGFENWHIRRLFSNGLRCGAADQTGLEVVNGKPTGVVRVSLGAMTTMKNIETFLSFIVEEFMLKSPVPENPTSPIRSIRYSMSTDVTKSASSGVHRSSMSTEATKSTNTSADPRDLHRSHCSTGSIPEGLLQFLDSAVERQSHSIISPCQSHALTLIALNGGVSHKETGQFDSRGRASTLQETKPQASTREDERGPGGHIVNSKERRGSWEKQKTGLKSLWRRTSKRWSSVSMASSVGGRSPPER